jgi:hypothetical protein
MTSTRTVQRGALNEWEGQCDGTHWGKWSKHNGKWGFKYTAYPVLTLLLGQLGWHLISHGFVGGLVDHTSLMHFRKFPPQEALLPDLTKENLASLDRNALALTQKADGLAAQLSAASVQIEVAESTTQIQAQLASMQASIDAMQRAQQEEAARRAQEGGCTIL